MSLFLLLLKLPQEFLEERVFVIHSIIPEALFEGRKNKFLLVLGSLLIVSVPSQRDSRLLFLEGQTPSVLEPKSFRFLILEVIIGLLIIYLTGEKRVNVKNRLNVGELFSILSTIEVPALNHGEVTFEVCRLVPEIRG